LARSAKSDRHLHGVLKTRCRGVTAAGAILSDADPGADEPASIQPSSSTGSFKRMILTAMATSEAAARVVTTPSSMEQLLPQGT